MSGRAYILSGLLCSLLASLVAALEPGKKYNFRFKDGQHLRNAILLEETKTNYRIRLEYISEEKVLEKKDLKETPVLAHSLSALPAPGSYLAGLKKVTITFAEPVTGAENPENYKITGTAAGTLKVTGVNPAGKYRYELMISGQAADGDLIMRLTGITDNVGVPLMSDSIEYKVDVTRPRVEASPAHGSPIRTLKEISLRYSEEVTDADRVENYSLSGAGLDNLKLKRVLREAGTENRYKLLFKGNPGNGEILIRLRNISDRVGNPLESPAVAYLADTIRPTLAVLPVADSLLRELKSIALNFSEPVVDANKPENYSVTGSGVGSLRISDIVRGEGGGYQVNFEGSPGSGSITVEISRITDLAGNPLKGNKFSYRTDVLRPEFSAVPAPNTVLAQLSTMKISFSKAVTGADVPENYLLEGDGVGSLALKEIRKIKAGRYELQFAGAPGDGKIILRLKNIADAAGNTLQSDTLEYLADVSPPQFTPSLEPESLVNAFQAIELQFSEAVTGADKAENYVLAGEAASDLKIEGVQALAENRYRLSLSGPLHDGRVNLMLKNISDKAGNPLIGNRVAYRADVTAPELQKIIPATNAALHDLSVIELKFSEPMLGSDNPQNYLLAGEGKGSLAIASATAIAENRVRLTLTGKPGGGKFSLQFNNTTDLAGNPLRAQAVEYRSDTEGPSFEADVAPGKVISELKSITLRFSEGVVGADKGENYRITGTGVGSLSITKVRSEKPGFYTLDLAGTPVDGEITLRVLNVSDMAGNPPVSDSLTFKADVTPPELVVSSPERRFVNKLDEIQLSFSEPVSGAERAENYRLSGAGVGTLQIAEIAPLPNNGFRLALSGKPGNGRIELQVKNITDLAGNSLRSGKMEYEADSIAPSYDVTPQPGTIAKEFSKIEVSYSEAVSGAAEVKNYALTGEGVGSLGIDQIEPLPGNKYRLILKGAPQSGQIQLGISGVADLAGNPLIQGIVVYQSDIVKPVLTVFPLPESVLNQLPSVTFRFSKPVSGADKQQNYTLKGAGVGSLRVEKITHSGPNEYQLILSGAPASGGITIGIGKISDHAGNIPETQSIRYELDTKPIELRVRPAMNSTLAQLGEVELEFSKPVEGAENVQNYLFAGDIADSMKINKIENRGKNKYMLRLSGDAAGGSVQIIIRNITDRAGNTLKNNRLEYRVEIPTASQPCGDIVR